MKGILRSALFAACSLTAAAPLLAGPAIPAEGTTELAFAPWDDAERLVMDQIDGAEKAIYVQVHSLTSRGIAKTLIAAHQRGLTVEIIADRATVMTDERSALPLVSGKGASLWLDDAKTVVRSNVMIIDPDGKTPVVVTGSYDFSRQGLSGDADNVLVLSGQRALARAYMDNWMRHRAQSVSFADAVSAAAGH
jgi:phosphatidylserine/phosphatidylglycerophosphate/cardiolipin synthase-like enzyme